MKYRNIIISGLVTIVLCLSIESVSYMILARQGKSVGFFWNSPTAQIVSNLKGMGYDEIDPLCGWAMSADRMKKMGYEVERGCAVLRSVGSYPVSPIKIFVTGGSTSDVLINKYNWPVALQQLLARENINATIYVAALGGYSTAQELLTLFRSGLLLKPDVHISYSGANEGYGDYGYVSDYEQSFYETALKQSTTTTLLPATIFLIKKTFNIGYTGLTIKHNEPLHPLRVWTQNMHLMKATAQEYNYQFIGILQPVAGIRRLSDSTQNETIQNYRTYFPQASENIRNQDTTLFDFTPIFDTATGKVFVDDCHITNPYQQVVAQNIFEVLAKTGSLK